MFVIGQENFERTLKSQKKSKQLKNNACDSLQKLYLKEKDKFKKGSQITAYISILIWGCESSGV